MKALLAEFETSQEAVSPESAGTSPASAPVKEEIHSPEHADASPQNGLEPQMDQDSDPMSVPQNIRGNVHIPGGAKEQDAPHRRCGCLRAGCDRELSLLRFRSSDKDRLRNSSVCRCRSQLAPVAERPAAQPSAQPTAKAKGRGSSLLLRTRNRRTIPRLAGPVLRRKRRQFPKWQRHRRPEPINRFQHPPGKKPAEQQVAPSVPPVVPQAAPEKPVTPPVVAENTAPANRCGRKETRCNYPQLLRQT